MTKNIQIRRFEYGDPEYRAAVNLRLKVLRQPIGLDFSREELAKDSDGIHFGAFDGDMLVGCLIMVAINDREIKMRQVAVDPAVQGQGVGRALCRAAEDYAHSSDYSFITLSARAVAIAFYQSLGYSTEGEPHVEVTLPHQKMKKTLLKKEGLR